MYNVCGSLRYSYYIYKVQQNYFAVLLLMLLGKYSLREIYANASMFYWNIFVDSWCGQKFQTNWYSLHVGDLVTPKLTRIIFILLSVALHITKT